MDGKSPVLSQALNNLLFSLRDKITPEMRTSLDPAVELIRRIPGVSRKLPESPLKGVDYVLAIATELGEKILNTLSTQEKLEILKKGDEILEALEREILEEYKTFEGGREDVVPN